jgi:tyrosyl-tRNA synthetase
LEKLFLLKKGFLEIISIEEFDFLIKSKVRLNIKVGFDPTNPHLHLGHFLILKKLSDFQKFGYIINILIGDFTATIGDPSNRKSSRQILNLETVNKNYKLYNTQIFRFLDRKKTNVLYNSSWLNFLSIDCIIKMFSLSTVSQIIDRKDFRERLESKKSVGMNEIIYPILQSFDSVFLQSDIEMGGIDQRLNFILARDLQKKFKQKPQIIMMLPTLIGLDGKMKMSKSFKNSINIDDSCFTIFSKIMSIPDFLVEHYSDVFNIYNKNFIKSCIQNKPMRIKMHIAFKMSCFFYNVSNVIKSKLRFCRLFRKKIIPSDFPTESVYVNKDKVMFYDILKDLNLINSKSEFKRVLKDNSIKINNSIVKDKNYILYLNIKYFIKIGKVFKSIILKNKLLD